MAIIPRTTVVSSLCGWHLNEAHPYLGEMIMDELGMLQQIRLEHLLSSYEHQYLLASGSARQQ